MVAIDTIEGIINGSLWFHYAVGDDVLYLRLMKARDLPTLGEETDDGERAIRLEYQHVASDAFRTGRSGVVRKFIERPHIYFTPTFKERYEWPARRNLQRSIERLAANS